MRQPRELAKRLCVLILAATTCSSVSWGQSGQSFVPRTVEGGVIRSWGDDAMGGVMAAWQKEFRRYHPNITFQNTLYGSGTGMAGIITGVSDLSLMGRAATANEVMGFEWVFRYKPLGVKVMTGGLKEEEKTPALAIFVNKSNPITQISIAQLAAILACQGEAEKLHGSTWALANADGAWRDRSIHAYIYDSETGTGAFLQRAVLGAGDRWNWSAVTEFRDTVRKDGTIYSAGQQTIDALRKDPNGIAVSTLGHAEPGVKALALSNVATAVLPDRESLLQGTYPLARSVYIYVNRQSSKPVNARVEEFLHFVLSKEGQDIVRSQGDYLPLNAATALEQRDKLE